MPVERSVEHMSDHRGDGGSYCLQQWAWEGVQWACSRTTMCERLHGSLSARRVNVGKEAEHLCRC